MLKMYFYTSLLSQPLDARKIASIIANARVVNRLQGVSGILLFDGMRFVQYIEGEQRALDTVRQKINHATSHHSIKQLNTVDDCHFKAYDNWSMGYVHDPDIADELNALIEVQYQSHEQIITVLQKITANSDIL